MPRGEIGLGVKPKPKGTPIDEWAKEFFLWPHALTPSGGRIEFSKA